jgi:hypothetical protein
VNLAEPGVKAEDEVSKPLLAMSVVTATTTLISTFGSEVWQQSSGKPGASVASHKVKSRLNIIHNVVLGTVLGTNGNVVRYEVGVPSQEV